jgi:MFS family permease
MVHAKSGLSVADETAGTYIWMMTIGSAVSSVMWGRLNDRRGPRSVVRGALLFVTLAPLLAITLSLAGESAGQHALGVASSLPHLYSAVFLCAGIASGGIWMGVTNYLFELASHEDRPRYIGTMSVLGIPGAFFPLLMGWLLTFLPFSNVLALFALCGIAALYSSWRMPEAKGSR